MKYEGEQNSKVFFLHLKDMDTGLNVVTLSIPCLNPMSLVSTISYDLLPYNYLKVQTRRCGRQTKMG